MGKRKYTSAIGLKAIEHYNDQLKWVLSCLKAKDGPIENQTEYIQSRSKEYFIGLINGTVAMTGKILNDDRCYYGFFYISESGDLITDATKDNPEYKEWCIHFIVKENEID